MFGKILGVVVALLACVPALVAAQEAAPVMDEVVVTATRQAEALAGVPANVTVVGAEEIAASAAQTLPELLRSVAGVLVSDITGNGRSYSVDLRGFGETAALNTLVLVDGRRLNQADLSGVDWTLIPKDRVARIEIVRGGRGSVLYGDNAAGGVINIITRQGGGEPTAKARVLVGSYDTYQASASVSGGSERLSVALDGSYRSTDGYRDNSDSLSRDAGFKLEFAATERLALSLGGGYHDDETSLPGALTKSELKSGVSRTDSLHPDDYAETLDKYLQGGAKYFITDNSYLALDGSKRWREAKFFSFFGAGEYEGATDIETLAFSPQLVIDEALGGRELKLVLGLDYEKDVEDLVNTSIFFGFPSVAKYELSRESHGAFAHGEVAVNDALSLSAGYRDDRARFKFTSAATGNTDVVTMDADLYTLGASYELVGDSTAYASYARSFRYPVLDEMYNFFANTVNEALGRQTADDFELGLRHTCPAGATLAVNLFYIVTDDEILYNPVSFANENLDGDSIRRGVEFTAQGSLLDVQLSGSYTYREAVIDGGQFDGRELPGVPKHQLQLAASKRFGEHLELSLKGNYTGERRFISDFDNSHDKLDDYVLLSGKLAYLLEQGSIYVAVNNLLDEEYAEYGALNWLGEEGYYPSPMANFSVGAEFRF
jgi:iron complex outermembrane receptor protein